MLLNSHTEHRSCDRIDIGGPAVHCRVDGGHGGGHGGLDHLALLMEENLTGYGGELDGI